VIIYRDAENRQRKEAVRTLDDARKLKATREAAIASGEHQAISRVRFAEYATEWVERYQGRGSRGFRESTRDDYRRDLAKYAVPYFEGKLRRRVEQITPRDVANFVAWLCDERSQGRFLADGTVRRIMAPLRGCLGSAVVEGLIRHNPTIGISLPARDEQRKISLGLDEEDVDTKALSIEELTMFFELCPPDWLPFFHLLSATGLRWSEITALRWRDIELDGSAPHVRVRRGHVRGRFGPPKSKYGRRDVPIDSTIVDELRAFRKSSEWFAPDELVFVARNGNPLRQENVRRRVLEPILQEAGVSKVGFHAFRHTCATRLFAAGRNAVQVQRWLGHHSPAYTLKAYVHLLNEDLGGPLENPKGGNRVATEATETARNDTQPLAAISL